MREIIFTDLDGTFLNHDDYKFDASKESREVLKRKNIPIIFTTSKTKVEVEILQNKVGIKEPFIVENGAAIFFPKNYQGFNIDFLEDYGEYKIFRLGFKYEKILEFYKKYKQKFNMLGFCDMSIEEISKYTSLPLNLAILAKQRDFSEPIIFEKMPNLQELEFLANEYDIKITQGGRFYHLMGKNQDKGRAVKKAKEIFSKLYGENIYSIGLGDGYNDVALLENVECPILMKNHYDSYIDIDIKNLQKSSFKGAKGWNEMVLKNVT